MDAADHSRMRELENELHEDQHWSVARELGPLYIAAGRFDELALMAGALTSYGDADAYRLLDEWLATPDRLAQAVRQLTGRADGGEDDWEAAQALAGLLGRRGLVDELLARAATGDYFAAMRAADALLAQHRAGEAIVALLPRGADGRLRTTETGLRAVALLLDDGRLDEALAVLGELADAGDWAADERRADLLVEHDRRTPLRAAADAGSWHARRRLAALLAERGELGELRVRADAGDLHAARQLAEVLARAGHDEALDARAAAGDHAAGQTLADLRLAQGDVAGAVRVLRVSAGHGDSLAAERLNPLVDDGD